MSSIDDRPKLLIADDEPTIRAWLKELGEELGFAVSLAAEGEEAWETYCTLKPDLVILDIYMPRLNGLAVLTKIKADAPECPVILVTGFLNYQQLINASRIRPDGCIVKPMSLENTKTLIMRLFQKSQARATEEQPA